MQSYNFTESVNLSLASLLQTERDHTQFQWQLSVHYICSYTDTPSEKPGFGGLFNADSYISHQQAYSIQLFFCAVTQKNLSNSSGLSPFRAC